MRYGLVVVLMCLTALISQAYAACGKVTVADMNWSSAELLANIDVFILKHGYGCDAELVPGDTMPTGTSMIEKGEPDIAPELWSNSFVEALQKGVGEKRLRIAGESLSDGGEEGFWVPQYLVDKYPSLATIEGVIKNKELFKHPEDPNKYAFLGCPAGWGCQPTTANLFQALELEKHGFEIIDPGSGAGLAGSMAKAYERKEGWFGYYWSPTPALGKYKMVRVDFGSGVKKDHFINCLTKATCENPQVSMFPSFPVYTITTEQFAVKTPEAYEYLTKRAFKNVQMSELLAWMEDNQADGDIAMEYFLKNYENSWTPWVPAEVAQKVKHALKQM